MLVHRQIERRIVESIWNDRIADIFDREFGQSTSLSLLLGQMSMHRTSCQFSG